MTCYVMLCDSSVWKEGDHLSHHLCSKSCVYTGDVCYWSGEVLWVMSSGINCLRVCAVQVFGGGNLGLWAGWAAQQRPGMAVNIEKAEGVGRGGFSLCQVCAMAMQQSQCWLGYAQTLLQQLPCWSLLSSYLPACRLVCRMRACLAGCLVCWMCFCLPGYIHFPVCQHFMRTLRV